MRIQRAAYVALACLIIFPVGLSLGFATEFADDIASLKKAAKDAKTAIAKKSVAIAALELANSTSDAEDFTSAKELTTLAINLARATRDPQLIQRATSQLQKHNEFAKQWKEMDEAKRALETTPDAPQPNEVIGRFLCFTRNSWDAGLKHLAKAEDPDLKAAATLDLQTSNDPASMVKAADAWWELATIKKKERTEILQRCTYWYEKALPKLNGLDKASAEKRIPECYEAIYGWPFTKILSEPANGVQSLGVLDCKAQAPMRSMGVSFNYQNSWLLSLQFNVASLESGSGVIVGWADGRADRDALVLRLSGKNLKCDIEDCYNVTRQQVTIPLTAKETGRWVDLKVVHNAIAGNLEFYLDGRRIRREPLTVKPSVDKAMPICIGGIQGTGQRYLGQVKSMWFGNIK